MCDLYDFIIIGGGPGGSTAATLLSRKGHKVLVLEKEKFPRPHVGESMLSESYHIFEELGVLEEMKERFVRKPGVEFLDSTGGKSTEWRFEDVIKGDSKLSFQVRRDQLDQMLLKNSRKNGAIVLEETKVEKIDLDNKDKVSVYTNSKEGHKGEFSGKFLIDASGQQSFLSKKLGSKIPIDKMRPKVAIYCHWNKARFDPSLQKGNIKVIRLELPNGGWAWMIPLGNEYLSVGVVIDKEFYNARRLVKQKETKDWIKALYNEFTQSSEVVSAILENAIMADDVIMIGDYSYDNSVKYSDNFAMIGDAASFVDPVFSSGVYLAMKSASILTEAFEAVIVEGDTTKLSKKYDQITSAYTVVKELVKNYYDPAAIELNELQPNQGTSYEQQVKALKIFHLILTGKFFSAPESYLETIKLLRDEKKFKQFEHYAYHKI